MQILKEEQGDKGCPNLNAQSIFAGTNEGLDLQMLFQGLEEDLDLPPVLIDGSDGARPELKMIGQKNYLSFIIAVPDDHTTKKMRAFLFCLETGEADNLIGKD